MAEEPSGALTAQANITTTAQGWFKAVSPAFLELVGEPVEALAGVNLIDLIHPLDAARTRQLLAKATSAELTSESAIRLFTTGDNWRPMDLAVQSQDDGAIKIALRGQAIEPAGTNAPTVTSDAATSGDDQPDQTDAPTTTATRAAVDDVVELRSAIRASAGAGPPMIELDRDGRVTFVAGQWSGLSTTGAEGSAAFEQLLDAHDLSGRITSAIHMVTHQPLTAGSGDSAVKSFEIALTENESRWIHVRAIPNPTVAGATNALVIASPNAQLDPVIMGLSAPVRSDPDVTSIQRRPAASSNPEAQLSSRWRVALLALAALLVAFLLLQWRSTDSDANVTSPFQAPAVDAPGEVGITFAEPITVEIEQTDPIQVGDAQIWQAVGLDEVDEVQAIAVGDGAAYIADVSGRVLRIDETTGAAISAIGVGAEGDTVITDMAIDALGTAWILDAGLGQVHRVDVEGRTWTIATDPNPVFNARGVGIGLGDTLWIASTASAQLIQVAPDGATISTIPLPDRQPSDVVELADGTIWIVDAQELELVHLTLAGEVITTVPLEIFWSTESPHIAVHGDELWVTEPEAGAVFAVDLSAESRTGQRIELIRQDGTRVHKAIGIGVDASGRVWVSDSFGQGFAITDTQS